MSFGSEWNHMYQETKHQKPNFTSTFGLLTHLEVDELRAYLNDDDKFESIVKDVKELKDIETEKEIVMASNRSLAEFNLSKEPHFNKRKQEIQQLSEEGEHIFNSIEAKSKELNNKGPNQSLETTLALLQTAAAEMEEESEELAKKFLDGSLDIDGFLEQFSSRRKLMHLRRVKADKMTEMVRKRSSISQASRSSGSNFYLPPPQLAPYPSVTPMPMPNMYVTSNHFG
ncbi:vacuolar protein sorting-associated protein 37B isoform X1 [Homalodisca vitripennis]|uniref:VPS37 C-terminal domain-containing protein n=1 Tax=Homalodisca liturata TaxID=320908 RepID=A0A1B6H6D1_9HEMI|nr:vacuolar protein sorting-associated protein 37B isoform X1 [Homalodisca vitripennis]XP_046682768.1 vacuolar protein sorting-associated protein 37B isoform X1 [Homalodisca vitripennis]KAG8241829.1 Vacuolar protein sorting-associated protein 37B [Homalodisca vitripennis]